MAKTIDTLVPDILAVVDGEGGWDEAINNYWKEATGETLWSRVGDEAKEHKKGTLRMSSIGQPCERKLWYSVNQYEDQEVLRPETKLKFLYGDLLEDLLLSLAKAAGHKVEGHQDPMRLAGIKGHRDAVIDGVTVDVKSASSFAFKKFKEHKLEHDDPFGYLTQLSSYVKAAEDDPLVEDKKGGAFLVIDKQHGTLCLDYYDFEETGHLEDVEDLINSRKATCADGDTVPPRGFSTEPDGKSGNMRLCTNCKYCDYKKTCWPELRTFLYSNGPKYLTEVVREPNVKELV